MQASLPPRNTPKDQYDLGYGYLQHKDYPNAADSFTDFLQQYPSDRLAPEAQYWLGEALFQNQQYRDAAEAFLAVSTKYENTARAPDALLKLGMSLAALDEKEAACASLGEVLRKYPRASLEREARRRPGTEACPLLMQPSPTPKRAGCFVVSNICPDLCSRFPAVRIRPRFSCSRRVGRSSLKRAPKLLAVTVDHGLRPEAAREATT